MRQVYKKNIDKLIKFIKEKDVVEKPKDEDADKVDKKIKKKK